MVERGDCKEFCSGLVCSGDFRGSSLSGHIRFMHMRCQQKKNGAGEDSSCCGEENTEHDDATTDRDRESEEDDSHIRIRGGKSKRLDGDDANAAVDGKREDGDRDREFEVGTQERD